VEILDLRDLSIQPNVFEGQTLKEVYSHSIKNDGYVLYIHNKGVTENFYNTWGVFGEDHKWRRYMQKHCISRWEECVAQVDEGYDSESKSLYESIKKHGVQSPVEILNDRVWDGHHRVASSAHANPKAFIPLEHS
jgi:L-rhamnose mutarotase